MQDYLKTGLGIMAGGLVLGALSVHADVRVDATQHGQIDIHGSDIVITADDDSQARISQTGDLSIRGKAVSLSAAQRSMLQQYSANMREIERRGMDIGAHATELATGIVGAVFADLMTGDTDQVDKDAKAKAEPIKQEAREICKVVLAQESLQDRISASLPAFKPYAVISEDDTQHNCHVDDDKD